MQNITKSSRPWKIRTILSNISQFQILQLHHHRAVVVLLSKFQAKMSQFLHTHNDSFSLKSLSQTSDKDGNRSLQDAVNIERRYKGYSHKGMLLRDYCCGF